MRTYEHIDLDYDSFPIPDLSLDLHFVHLSATEHRAQINAQISARHEAEAQAHPTYSPRQAELWPLISPSSSSAVQEALRPYPGIFTEVLAAIHRVVDAHRGWQNPFPPDVPAPA